MASLEALLAGRQLSSLVEGIKSGIPSVMPEAFFNVTDEFSGHTAEWLEVDGQRDLATIVSQKSPAKRVGHQNTKSRSAVMLRSFESQNHTANDLRNLVTIGDPAVKDAKGKQFLTRQAEWFKKRQDNLRIAAAHSMLLRFGLYFGNEGNLLSSSSGATVSVDPSIPAGQKTTLDILGTGAILGTTWGTSSTQIIQNLFDIRDQMLQLGGWNMAHIFYGKNIPKYIAANDEAKQYIQQTPALAQQKWDGGNIVPNGFCDYTWHNAASAYYIDSAGTAVKYLGDDEIVVCPDPSPEWWGMFDGSEMVPNGPTIGGGVDAMLAGMDEVMGPFMYAAMEHNPLSIELFAGRNFLPVIRATKAVCRGDVVP